jgi:hypothetical protein
VLLSHRINDNLLRTGYLGCHLLVLCSNGNSICCSPLVIGLTVDRIAMDLLTGCQLLMVLMQLLVAGQMRCCCVLWQAHTTLL